MGVILQVGQGGEINSFYSLTFKKTRSDCAGRKD